MQVKRLETLKGNQMHELQRASKDEKISRIRIIKRERKYLKLKWLLYLLEDHQENQMLCRSLKNKYLVNYYQYAIKLKMFNFFIYISIYIMATSYSAIPAGALYDVPASLPQGLLYR